MASLGDMERATLSANSDISSQTSNTSSALQNLDTSTVGNGSAFTQMKDFVGDFVGLETDVTSKIKYATGEGSIFGIGATTYDFVGIADENGVTEMKNAVTKYCNEVKDAMAAFAQTADPGDTFRGSYAEEIKSFVTAIKNSCDSTVDSLTKFNKDLDAVYASMLAKSQSVASNISNDTSSVRSATNIESN